MASRIVSFTNVTPDTDIRLSHAHYYVGNGNIGLLDLGPIGERHDVIRAPLAHLEQIAATTAGNRTPPLKIAFVDFRK
jgi:hypothetical protein